MKCDACGGPAAGGGGYLARVRLVRLCLACAITFERTPCGARWRDAASPARRASHLSDWLRLVFAERTNATRHRYP